MTKWEYQSLIVQVTKTGPNIDLAKLGAEGWELVSVVPKIATLNIPELKIKVQFRDQSVTAQENAWHQTTELIYTLKRPII